MKNKEINKKLIQMIFLLSILCVGVGNVSAAEEATNDISSSHKRSLLTQENLKDKGESDTDSTDSVSFRSSEEHRKSLEEAVPGGLEIAPPYVNQTPQDKGVEKVEKKLTLKERMDLRHAQIQEKNRRVEEERIKEAQEYAKQVHNAFENAEVLAIRYDENGHEIGRTLRVKPGSLPPSRLKHPIYPK